VIVRAWEKSPVLIVMAGARACAIPLDHVAETMCALSTIEPVGRDARFRPGRVSDPWCADSRGRPQGALGERRKTAQPTALPVTNKLGDAAGRPSA